MGEDYKGYRDPALGILKENRVRVWSDVKMETSRGEFTGIILPRSETADARHIVMKLRNGYNIGIAVDTIQKITEASRKEAHYKIPEKEFPYDPAKPNVKLLGTGGTIASRLDYRTGAVIPAFSPGELYGSVPELADKPKNFLVYLVKIWGPNSGSLLQKPSVKKSGREYRELLLDMVQM